MPKQPGLKAYLATVAACLLTTAVALALLPLLDPANLVMLFLLVVLLLAMRLGRGPAVLATFLSVALFDFFLVPPRLSFAVADVQYLVTFVVMLAVALTTAHLASGLRQQADAAATREAETRLLYELASAVSGTLTNRHIVDTIQPFFQGLGMQAVLLLPDDHGHLHAESADGNTPRHDAQLAHSVFTSGETVTVSHMAAFGEACCYLPLKAPMRMRGVLAVTPQGDKPVNLPMLGAAASVIAIALERVHYVDVAQATELEMRAERLRSSVLSALSHDVRTPLTALVGLADTLALSEPGLSARGRETAAAIREQAGLMHTLVENLLEMARLNSGNMILRKDWCLIEDVIGSSLKLLRPALSHHQILTDIEAPGTLIEFDPVLIERVIGNLLENASKYTPPGCTISMRSWLDDAALHVAVSDDGPGIPGRSPAELFTLFVRGQAESATPGMGVGLAICKAIIDAHGGKITTQNNVEGRGACFRFSLPRGHAPALDDESVVMQGASAT